MKNIFKFLFVCIGLCQVANATTSPFAFSINRSPLNEIPALKPAIFIKSGTKIDLTNVDTSQEECGIKNRSSTDLTYKPLATVIDFLDWDSRRQLMNVSKSMLSVFFAATSVAMESEYCTLSLQALFSGIKLNARLAGRAFSKYFLPKNCSLAEFIAAGAGISLS